MRLVAGLLALTLTGSLAFADEAKAPEPQPEVSRTKVGLRVVKLMPESHQALLFDKNRGTHVLADVGSAIGAYTVTAIDEDEVTLTSGGREIILPAPEPAPAPKPARTAAKRIAAADTQVPADPYSAAIEALSDPYADGPADPYADGPVRSADAPSVITAGDGGVRVARAPSTSAGMANPYDEGALDGSVRSATAPSAPTAPIVTITEMEVDPYGEPAAELDPYATPELPPIARTAKPAQTAKTKKAAPLDDDARAFAEAMSGETTETPAPEAAWVAPDPAPAPAPAGAQATMLSRAEVNTALSDFGLLTASVRGAFTPTGARLDAVAPGSVFAKAGLRNGDVITAVDGQPMTSIDAAADLYIRAGSARTAKVSLVRDGKPMTLRLAIQ